MTTQILEQKMNRRIDKSLWLLDRRDRRCNLEKPLSSISQLDALRDNEYHNFAPHSRYSGNRRVASI